MKQKKRGKPNHRRRRAQRRRQRAMTALIAVLVLVMLALAAYIVHWYVNLSRIRANGERYSQLYSGRDATEPPAGVTEAPTATEVPAVTEAATTAPEPTAIATPAPTAMATPTAEPTAVPTPTPEPTPTTEPTPESTATAAPALESTSTPEPTPTAQPTAATTRAATATPKPTQTATPSPTPAPTATPVPSPTPLPLGADMPIVEDELIPTPNADTLVYALPTPPPVQASFEALLASNPDTVGFLEIEEMLSLPVVQRENDNNYYLNHTFDGDEALEGALFMDGLNRLVPEDDCLIVYGHNMKNKTMFGRLSSFGDVTWLRQHSIVHFDTLYENRSYVPFAAFSASTTPGNRQYFDVRQFIFDEVEFDKFVLKLQSRSTLRIPVDVRYGDHLLLLVTCDYTTDTGRFILALRQLRPDETDAGMWARVVDAEAK